MFGLTIFVWLAIFGFKYYTLNQGCWFPAISVHGGGYVCTDPYQAQTSSVSAGDLAALTVPPGAIIEFAALSATTNTVMLAILAGVMGAVAAVATNVFRKLRGHR